MKYTPFEKLFNFQPKSKIKAGDGVMESKFPFYTSSKTLSKMHSDYTYAGDALIMGTGGSASIHYQENKFSCSTDCLVATPKDKEGLLTKYVYYYILANCYVLDNGFKGAGLKHISKSYINKIDIPLPSGGLSAQKIIVKVLDKADAIRCKRAESLRLADEFLKSVFLDMFGDPVKNSWDITTIEHTAENKKGSMRTGPFGSQLLKSEFSELNGVSVLGIDNAVANEFKWGERRYVSREKYQELKRYTVFPNDIIITIMGTCGRCAIVPKDIPLAINTKHLCCITPNTKRWSSTYIHSFFLHHPMAQKYLSKSSKGAVMDGLNMGLIKDMPIAAAPLKLQVKYETIVNKLNKSKHDLINALTQSSELFDSLSQKAFRGEL